MTLAAFSQEPERIGVYSGTFDPPHLGHFELALQAQKKLHLDKVYVIPAIITAHKPNSSPYYDRLAMVKLQFQKLPNALFPDAETEKGYYASRTRGAVDILFQRHPRAQFFRLTGDDTISKTIATMSEAQLQRTTLVITPREGANKVASELTSGFNSKGLPIVILKSEAAELSSTMARSQIKNKELSSVLDSEVAQYIKKHRLYRPNRPLHRSSCSKNFTKLTVTSPTKL